MGWRTVLCIAAALAVPSEALARPFHGPGRFCGYSPIIDLAAGEIVEPLQGGIHGGTFRWTGAFGTLDVRGIGWASKPKGRTAREPTSTGNTFFRERRDGNRFVISIWNRSYGAAYFFSSAPFTQAQRDAIQRVYLFDERKKPQDCTYRTIFAWE